MKRKKTMAFGDLSSGATTAADGAHIWGPTLVLVHNDETAIRNDNDAAQKKNLAYQAAKGDSVEKNAALEEAVEKAKIFITVTRELLKPKLGSRYSRAWDEAGFFNRTLEVPRSTPKRLAMVNSLKLFLEAHPELQVAGTATPEIGTTVYDDLSGSITAVNSAQVAQRKAKSERDVSVNTLRARLQNLYRELKQFLGPDDARWLDFGFHVPDDQTVPDAPKVFSVSAGAAGHLVLNWALPSGATRVRVFRQIVGVDAEFVHIDTLKESSKDIGGFTSGAHVKFYITAANGAGESQPSQTVEMVVP